MSVVPPVLNALANHPKLCKEHFASLRYVSCGAAPTDADLQAKFMAKSGIKDVRQGWGMTGEQCEDALVVSTLYLTLRTSVPETTVSCLGFTPNAALGTVGYVLPGAQVSASLEQLLQSHTRAETDGQLTSPRLALWISSRART